MKYELDKFESLIEIVLNPSDNQGEKLHARNIAEKKITTDNETERIKKAIIDEVFSLNKDKQVERYIQQHQSALIRLCNSLLKHISPKQFKTSLKEANVKTIPGLCFYIYFKLEHILNFIESYFTKYFNQDEKIPTSYRIIGQLEFREKIKTIDHQKKCELMEIALYPIQEFISQNSPITYRNLIYLKELFNEIKTVCPKCNEKKYYCRLRCNLIYLNFNSYKFFTHLTIHIKNEFQKEESLTKQVEIVSFHLKKLNQAQIKPNFAYKPNHTSIKEQLTNWILEEMAFIEKKHQLTLKFPNANIDEINSRFKLITNLSVSQVAYFIRILVETGVIQNKNPRELIYFFASHIKTKKTENISPESFRNKYYGTEESAKEVVREMIIKLMNETQKNY